MMFKGVGQTKSQDRFGGAGEKCVDRVGNTVQICLECEEVVSVEVVELVEVTVELGKGGGEGGDECGWDTGVGESSHVVKDAGGAGVWWRWWCVRERGRLKIDHDSFVIGELEVGVLQDCAAGDEMQVTEGEDGVVDDGGAVDLGRTKT
jgi:hypothetical protein